MTRSSRQDLLVKVSTLYHKEGLTQGEIASRVKVSRQTVSRLLREAEDVGIVSFDIRDPSGQVNELGMRLRSRFNLAAASVVDGGRRKVETTAQSHAQFVDLARRIPDIEGDDPHVLGLSQEP